MQTVATLYEGKAAQQAANYNAQMIEQEAEIAQNVSRANAAAQRRRARAFMGTARAAAGQTGLGMAGSIKDVLDRSAAEAELDAMNIEYGGNLKAIGAANQAAITRWQGKQARKLGNIKAAAQIISAASGSYSGGGGFDSGKFMRSA